MWTGGGKYACCNESVSTQQVSSLSAAWNGTLQMLWIYLKAIIWAEFLLYLGRKIKKSFVIITGEVNCDVSMQAVI
jgi:hypothetical protein